MFLGKFNESGNTEIKLTGIDGYHLQKYLEMLYGEDALDGNLFNISSSHMIFSR